MREVFDLASGMRDAIAGIKKAAVDAKNDLSVEIARAQDNAGKVRSVTADLKAANKEVESFLGETGSNFPPSGQDSVTPPPVGAKADVNGVTVSSGTSTNKADINGVTINSGATQ